MHRLDTMRRATWVYITVYDAGASLNFNLLSTLVNVLSIGYKLGKTTSAQLALVISTCGEWRGHGACAVTCSALRCNCRVLEYQIFLKYPVVQQVIHRFKWSVYIFHLKCCRFREDRYYLSIFPKDRSSMSGQFLEMQFVQISQAFTAALFYAPHYPKFCIIKRCSYFESTPHFERMAFKFKVNLSSSILEHILSG